MQRIVGKNSKGENRVYAIFDQVRWDKQFVNQGTQWYTKDEHGIQVSQMRYNKGKQFPTHKHQPYPRTANLTQEFIAVFQGKLGYKIWDEQKKMIAVGEIGPGEFIILFGGWHEFTVLEDNTLAIETKNGPYTSVEKDKEFMNGN